MISQPVHLRILNRQPVQANPWLRSSVCLRSVGLINYDDDNNEVFIGRDLAHTARGYGEGVATVIDQEVKRIIDDCYTEQDISLENMRCAACMRRPSAGKRKDYPGRI